MLLNCNLRADPGVTVRLSENLAERMQLANEIFRLIEPKLRLFIFGTLPRPAAEDVHQEVLKAIATGLSAFAGNTPGEFWAWCYLEPVPKLSNRAFVGNFVGNFVEILG